MTTSKRIEAGARPLQGWDHELIRQPDVRCPYCSSAIDPLPAPWAIEPCGCCQRPLTIIRAVGSRPLYRVCNVIDLVGSVYGIVSMLLVASFVLSEMEARTFAKAVTILLFVIGSLLLVDGALSVKTAIDRTWKITRRGLAARLLGIGKTIAGALAIGLVLVGLHL